MPTGYEPKYDYILTTVLANTVHIDCQSDGSIKLTQKGLIQCIIDALDITHLPSKQTPSKLGVVGTSKDGDLPDGTFSYASVV